MKCPYCATKTIGALGATQTCRRCRCEFSVSAAGVAKEEKLPPTLWWIYVPIGIGLLVSFSVRGAYFYSALFLAAIPAAVAGVTLKRGVVYKFGLQISQAERPFLYGFYLFALIAFAVTVLVGAFSMQ